MENLMLTDAIASIMEEAERMKKAYFFHPPIYAGDRRRYEKQHSHSRVEWVEGGHSYSAEYVVICSRNNVYAYGKYERDGKKTTITAIRNSYKRLLAMGR